MIYIHYLLLFFKNDNFKYTTASHRLTFNFFLLSHIFFFVSSLSFLLSLFKLLCTNKHHVCKQYRISYTLRVFAMKYVTQCRKFSLMDISYRTVFIAIPQQIKSVVANESLTPYNLIKRAPYLFWVENSYELNGVLAHILSN